MRGALAILASITAALAGCVALPIPHDRLVTPVVAGTIIDAVTRRPVSGAKVVASASSDPSDEVASETLSDENGRFEVAARRKERWVFIVLLAPFEGFCAGKYTVTKDGYKPLRFDERYFGPANFNGVCESRPIRRELVLQPL